MNESSRRFDAIAANYATSEVHRASPTVRKVQELLAAQHFESIVDIASGAGHFGFAFAEKAKSAIAVDPSPQMRENVQSLARQRNLAVQTVDARAESLPFADGSFDLTLCRLAPHHFTDIEKAVREFARVTRPGGTIAVIDLQGAEDPAVDALNHQMELLHDPTHVRSYRASEWQQWLTAAGLQVELHRDQAEFPDGLSLARWCEIANSGAAAEAQIRQLLAAADSKTLEALGILEHAQEYFLCIRTILIVAKKRAEAPTH